MIDIVILVKYRSLSSEHLCKTSQHVSLIQRVVAENSPRQRVEGAIGNRAENEGGFMKNRN